MLVTLLTNWNADAAAEAKAKNSIHQTSNVTINNQKGIFAQINEDGQQYYAAVGVLGKDDRFSNTNRALLSTCGSDEKDTLTALVGTIVAQ